VTHLGGPGLALLRVAIGAAARGDAHLRRERGTVQHAHRPSAFAAERRDLLLDEELLLARSALEHHLHRTRGRCERAGRTVPARITRARGDVRGSKQHRNRTCLELRLAPMCAQPLKSMRTVLPTDGPGASPSCTRSPEAGSRTSFLPAPAAQPIDAVTGRK
jgi:hypothetical protein